MTNQRSDFFDRFFNDPDRFFGDFFKHAEGRITDVSRAVVRLSKHEEAGVLVIEADLPGVSRESLQVTFTEDADGFNRLRVEGVRGEREIRLGTTLAERIEPDAATAALVDGVLTVRVPLVPRPEDRVVTVEVA